MSEKPQVALTFDIELWHETAWLKPYITPDLASQDNFTESIEYIRNTLKRFGHRATFFVTGKVLDKYPHTIRTLAADGHEIGSHCFEHQRLSEIGSEKFHHGMIEHVQQIEAITNQKPKGFRAPHFALNQNTRWLLPILQDLGFRYDTSLFPIKTSQYGLSNVPHFPYPISFDDIVKIDHHSPILEIPVAAAHYGPVTIPAAGGVYFRLMPALLFAWLVQQASHKGTPVLYFHQHELRADTPQIKGPLLKTKLKYAGLRTSARKFEYLCERFSFNSIEKIWNL